MSEVPENRRYTPKHSLTALRQKWLAVNPDSERVGNIGRVLAQAAKDGPNRFQQVCRELFPETDRGSRR
jgi:hypothetical protein